MVNLTCGRNPWKRASLDDPTFLAYLRDPGFLRSILPISAELDSILHRIFETDPLKRITIHELHDLIVACPRLTCPAYNTPPATPEPQPIDQCDVFECANLALPPCPPATPPPPSSFSSQSSLWSLLESTSNQSSLSSISSDGSDYQSEAIYSEEPPYTPPLFNFYGNIIPLSDVAEKPFFHQTFQPALVSAY